MVSRESRLCGINFPDSDILTTHMEIHPREMRNCHASEESKLSSKVQSSLISPTDQLPDKCSDSEDGHFKCDDCGKRFAKLILLKVHMKLHSKEKTFQCVESGKISSNKEKSDDLGKQNAPEPCKRSTCEKALYKMGSKECKSCSKPFTDPIFLCDHMELHSKEGKTCSMSQLSKLSNKPQSTVMSQTKGNTHKCRECNKTFPDPMLLSEHMKLLSKDGPQFEVIDVSQISSQTQGNSHTKEIPYKCSECYDTFLDPSALKEHNWEIHSRTEQMEHVEEPSVLCSLCGKTFLQLSSLQGHMATHIERQFKCAVCGEHFDSSDSITEHMGTHIVEETVPCYVCDERFIGRFTLQKHIQNHMEDGQFKCDDCGKKFAKLQFLKIHMEVHSGDTQCRCSECGKTFKSSERLNVHKKTHTVERAYKCMVCDKAFVRLELLKMHMRVHTGERPYKCNVCCKRFALSSGLWSHRKIHSGGNTYLCRICFKRLSGKENLQRHFLTHMEGGKFKCSDCGKLSANMKTLIVHMKLHTGVKTIQVQ